MRKVIAGFMVAIFLLSLGGTAVAGPVQSVDRIPVIIVFKDKPDPALIRTHGGDIKYEYHLIPAIAASMSPQARDAIAKNKNVAYVEPDCEVQALQTLPWGVDRIDADLVWSYNKGTGVNVSIIDTGIDYTHPDLDANYKGGYDFANDDADPKDDNGHGTHCAGIVAAEDNDIGVVGVAPEANLYAVKVLNRFGSGWLSDVIAGIDWSVDNDMDVVSMSLGTSTYSASLETACNNAYNTGLVLVAAAGNSGDGDPTTDEYSYPAAYGSVIAVGATDSTDVAPSWSNSGPYLELAAPGVSIYSTLPTYRVTLTRTYGYDYGTLSGTSMACPHVTGTAALVIASNPTLTNVDVRSRLQATADDLGPVGWDSVYGYGLVDADEAAPGDALPTVNVVNPVDGSIVSGSVTIQVDASDDVGVDVVEYSIDDGAYQVMGYNSETGYWEAVWDSTGVADGLHTITARATDTIGQTSTDSITVTVDNIDDSPTVAITSPADGTIVSGTVTIEASAGDDKGVSKVDFYIDDAFLATDDTEPYSAIWDTTSVVDGAHAITAIATDTIGQTASDSNGVVVDNTPPAQVTGLAITTVSSSQLDLSWDANTETDLDHYNVYRSTTSGGPYDLVASSTTNSYSNTGLAASTTYYYTVSAVDTAGNEGAPSAEASGTTSEAPVNIMHVASIDMSAARIRLHGWYTYATATVTIVDADDNPVEGATVSGHWSGLTSDTDSGLTDINGRVALESDPVKNADGTFTFTVDDVVLSGWTYDPTANAETSDSITV